MVTASRSALRSWQATERSPTGRCQNQRGFGNSLLFRGQNRVRSGIRSIPRPPARLQKPHKPGPWPDPLPSASLPRWCHGSATVLPWGTLPMGALPWHYRGPQPIPSRQRRGEAGVTQWPPGSLSGELRGLARVVSWKTEVLSRFETLEPGDPAGLGFVRSRRPMPLGCQKNGCQSSVTPGSNAAT